MGTVLGADQGEDPSYDSGVRHCGLLMATSRHSKSLVLDHLKFLEVRLRHMSEPDEFGVMKDGAHASSFYTMTGMRAKGEVGVQRDRQDLIGSVQRGNLIPDLHLWVEPGLVGVQGEQRHVNFFGAMAV